MHVAHFHPPRAVAVTLIAAVLAIVLTLAIAARLNDTTAGSASSAGRTPAVSRLVPAPPSAHSTATRPRATPAWLTSPLSPLVSDQMIPGMGVRGGS